MKLITVLILSVCLFIGCDSLRGPTGPEGPQGETGDHGPQGVPGKNFKFTILEGTLAPGEPEYWVIETDFDLKFCIISVFVSNSIEPTWVKMWDEIWILNDVLSDSGYPYRIIIASNPMEVDFL